jgi:hypothetical protein
MLNSKYVSLESIIEEVYINQGYQTIDWAEAAHHVGRAMEKLTSPELYVDKITNGTEFNVEPLLIEGYKALLPRDLVYIKGVRDYNTKITFVENTDLHYLNPTGVVHPTNSVDPELSGSGATQFTPTVNASRFKAAYKLNDDYIFTNIDGVELEISYVAMPTDSRGLPLIPDNGIVKEALQAYLTERLDWKSFRKGEINQQVYQMSRQNSHFAMAAAATNIATPSMDKMQAIQNAWMRMLPNLNSHNYGFANEAIPERRRIH